MYYCSSGCCLNINVIETKIIGKEEETLLARELHVLLRMKTLIFSYKRWRGPKHDFWSDDFRALHPDVQVALLERELLRYGTVMGPIS